MIKREIEETLLSLSRGYPVVAVTGPRQSGKTTLVRGVFPEKDYVSLENPDVRERAQQDTRGFLEKYKAGAVIDEVQLVPEIFSYLQQIIDESEQCGLFILTGSQQFGMMSGITQSLAGRAAIVQLLPFSYNEWYGRQKPTNTLDEILFKGLYPPVHDRNLDPGIWYSNYMQTYIERDVRKIVNVKDLSTFQRFLRLCAGRIGQLMNFSEIANDCGVSHNTIRSWTSILEASYIIFQLQPYHKNFNKRIIKTPKLYFHDTGLACRLLSIQSHEQLNTDSRRGALFESWVISEALKKRFASGLTGDYYFWRDRTGNEVDLISDRGEQLVSAEIKSGSTFHPSSTESLDKFTTFAKGTAVRPVLIFGGDQSFSFNETRIYPWYSETEWFAEL